MECFTANILEFCCKNIIICFLGGRVGICRQIQAFQGFFGHFFSDFLIFQDPQS